MKLTKYEHACFTIEKEGQVLVVDPGVFTTDFVPPENVVAVIITHTHPDHFDPDQLSSLIDKNPDAVVIGCEAVTSQIEIFAIRTVSTQDSVVIGPFELQFRGGKHALIHQTIPRIDNLGVIVNDLLYYPGDSFVLPGGPIDTLALPASAPWMKTSEAMDFLLAAHPRFAFPTHDALLSKHGKDIADRLLGGIAQQNNIEYERLTTTISI